MSSEANRPWIGLPEVLSTCALSLICRPPNVKVIPPVIENAQYGGLSIGLAQLDFFGSIPSVHLPSSLVASDGTSIVIMVTGLSILFIQALDEPGAFELVHERVVDERLDAHFGDLWVELN